MEPNKRNIKLRRNTAYSKKNGNHRRSATKMIVKLFGLILILGVTGTASWAAKAYFELQSTVNSASDGNAGSDKISDKKPVSILLLGLDTGAEGRKDRGNSDTMILATANPETNKSTLTSIPRDLLTQVKGIDNFHMGKINSAYNINGSKSAMKTVSNYLNVPVDYYVTVDMAALEALVNAVGGIDVDVPFPFEYGWTKFKKGPVHLNGHGALDYARMRHEDPEGDYGRQKRQRQVIEGILKEGMSLDSVSNYQKILKVVSKYLKTNLTFNDMMSLAMNYRDTASNLKSDYIHGHDAWIGEVAYQVAKTSELQRVSDKVRKSLGLKKEKLHNEATRQNSLQSELDWKNAEAFNNYTIYDENSDSIAWSGEE